MLLAAPVRAQQPRPLSDRRVAYDISVALDARRHVLHGTEQITWRIPDRVPVFELQFHLYLNGFRNGQSAFMKESGGRHRSFTGDFRKHPGSVDIRRMKVTVGNRSIDVTSRIRFIDPSGQNPGDSTVISVPLPVPVPAGGTARIDVAFESRLPRIVARTGWERRSDGTLFYMIGQWFPKLGVYEAPGTRYVPADAPRGQWSTHTFHLNTEFYADFGTYRVRIDVPRNYVVGASGVRTSLVRRGGRAVHTYRADDVHDFGWTASPAFVERFERWKHVRVRLLLQPEHAGQAERHLAAARAALAYFERTVGPYPYRTLTIVDAVGGAMGMEYPTLITAGTGYGVPCGLRFTEAVLIHEFAHQYYYGILASNEAAEPWLDEGFASYLESRTMDAAYGPASQVDYLGLRWSSFDFYRVGYTESRPELGVIYAPAWTYSAGVYGRLAYNKPVVVLGSLEGLLGRPVMQRVFREYYRRWAFRHPTTRDFIEVAERVSGRDLDWFFRQFVYENAVVDYAVGDLSGSRVTLRRLKDGVLPVMVRVRFEDGKHRTFVWNGRDPSHRLRFDRDIAEVWIDPENRFPLDVNPLNNRRVARPDPIVAHKMHLKVGVWLQQLLTLLRASF